MSKKKSHRQKKSDVPKRNIHSRRKSVVIVGLILCLGLTTLILAQWRSIRSSFGPPSPIPQTSPAPQLSKEYIYAGGRLVAIEEAGSGNEPSPLAAPASLTAIGESLSGYKVNLSWQASTSPEAHHYQLERCSNITITPNCYEVVAPNVQATGGTITYTDTITNINGVTAYLYRVRAANAFNTSFSAYTTDLATTISFEDDPLNPNGTKTTIRAKHLTQLREAVNAVRVLADIGQTSWTHADPVSDPPSQRRPIFLKDLTELREKLDEALSPLQRVQPYPSEPPLTLGSRVNAEHFTQIRDRVK